MNALKLTAVSIIFAGPCGRQVQKYASLDIEALFRIAH